MASATAAMIRKAVMTGAARVLRRTPRTPSRPAESASASAAYSISSTHLRIRGDGVMPSTSTPSTPPLCRRLPGRSSARAARHVPTAQTTTAAKHVVAAGEQRCRLDEVHMDAGAQHERDTDRRCERGAAVSAATEDEECAERGGGAGSADEPGDDRVGVVWRNSRTSRPRRTGMGTRPIHIASRGARTSSATAAAASMAPVAATRTGATTCTHAAAADKKPQATQTAENRCATGRCSEPRSPTRSRFPPRRA